MQATSLAREVALGGHIHDGRALSASSEMLAILQGNKLTWTYLEETTRGCERVEGAWK